MNKYKSIVPDTSVLIIGYLSDAISKGEIETEKIILPKAAISELQNQASKGLKIGIDGLEEISKLREISAFKNIEIIVYGERPGLEEIRLAKSGSIDNMILDVARETNSVLFTADRLLYKVALAYGVEAVLIEKKIDEKLLFEEFFTEDTMSVHIVENSYVRRKRGKPGNWYLEETNIFIDSNRMEELINNILYVAKNTENSFVEIERKYSYIVQIKDYRIVITKKPLSDSDEITIVKPIRKLSLVDYNIDKKLLERLEKKAEGIIIVGRPGSGKSTFARSLAEYYSSKKKIVKTIESPRDLTLGLDIVQYSKQIGSSEEIHDILLLSRPDYVVFDEMRDTEDFRLYIDLRLAGVGMIGVSHAERPIDIIHRLISRTELGLIPQVIDTIIYMDAGKIEKVYYLEMKVKVPSGLKDLELARPVIEVRDFYSDDLEYEIYSFGEEVVIIPIKKYRKKSGTISLLEDFLLERFREYDILIDVESDRIIFYVPKNTKRVFLRREKSFLLKLKNDYKINIYIRSLDDIEHRELPYNYEIRKNEIFISLGKIFKNRRVKIYAEDKFLGEFNTNKKGNIVIDINSEIGSLLKDYLSNKKVKIFLS